MNNKKITLTFILIAVSILLGIIGFTIAYFTSSVDFENEFQTGLLQTQATETFVSPENWLPGDTTPKTLTVTNTGNVDVKARVCIEEAWTSDQDNPLSLKQGDEKVAIINLDNTDDWVKKGNCYEYNDVLEPNDETSSFIKSVTFNPNVKANIECTTTSNNGTTTKECNSTGYGYDDATYKLTLRVETVQANKASDLWSIEYINRQVSNAITLGDEISIEGEHFFVLSSDSNKTTLIAKYNLLVGTIHEFTDHYSPPVAIKAFTSSDEGYGLQNEITRGYDYFTGQSVGTVPFSMNYYWIGPSLSGLLQEYANENNPEGSRGTYISVFPYVYRSNLNTAPIIDINDSYSPYGENDYTIAYYVEEYVNTLKELGAPNTIVGRLITKEEADSIYNQINPSYVISNQSLCQNYIKNIWDYYSISYDNNRLISFCNDSGNDINGQNLEFYINHGVIPPSDLLVAGISDVVFPWISYISYWYGSAYDYYQVHDSNLKEPCNATHKNGVRPVIEIPTSELS